ncbi:CRE-OTUB-1 protein [Caenorhabditis remanei]|uniref:Ubiquitin thioesterase n=1 Tax=Caenorhabditis remanei TaxID=31234 RepID=E3NCI9_CAERE|nr:CRE-OTUB-1 protein [Caenorhabditis remanei]
MANDSDENKPTSTAAMTEDDLLLQDQQLKQIEDEQKASPLVGDKLPFYALAGLYDPVSAITFFTKANELAAIYSDIRFIRGDGNCFYRAVLVGIVEILMKDRERLIKFIDTGREWMAKLVKLGFPDWTCSDFCEFFIEFLEKIRDGKYTEAEVFQNLNDDGTANYLLMYFRLITSGFLKDNCEEYAPFIAEGMTLQQYCETEIEAMWKEADHLSIMALVRATGIRLRIQYMDRSEAPNGGYQHDLPDEADNVTPDITLLYRPGHYDLIYRNLVAQ